MAKIKQKKKPNIKLLCHNTILIVNFFLFFLLQILCHKYLIGVLAYMTELAIFQIE